MVLLKPNDCPLAPADANVGLVEDPVMLNAHAAPAWFTVYDVFAIVSVPLRGVADWFASAAKRASPVPPDPDEMIESHGALLDEDHWHTDGAVTRTDPDPPAAGADPVSDPSSNVHAVPDWVMLMVWPATVNVPVRPVTDAALDVTVTPIVPLPLPEVADNPAHGTLLAAVHAQFAPLAVMPIDPVAPLGPYGDPSEVVSTVTLHASGSCVMTKDCPPIVSVPVRDTVVGFAAAEYTRLPVGPAPDAPDVTVIQFGPVTVL